MSEPLFSIIVPTRNRPELLKECLGSIRSQTVADFECIVVDDGSDMPAAVPDDDRFRVIRKAVGGGRVSKVRNSGLREARGRYVVLLDDDDLFTPTRLALGLKGLEKARVALCWTGRVQGPTDWVRDTFYEYGNVYDSALDTESHFVSTITIARADAPEFDERFVSADDKDWWLRIAKDLEVFTVPEIGFLHREHTGPRVSGGLEGRLSDLEILFEKHPDYFEDHPHVAARQWNNLAWLALHHNKFVLAGRFLKNGITTDASITGFKNALQRVRPMRQMAMKARGSFRKRVLRR